MKNPLVKKLKLRNGFKPGQYLWLEKAMTYLNRIQNLIKKSIKRPRIPGQCPP